tara:strand:+ start:189 stop:716 length:528 start_codon:yes stop_codon:yes gene_type:complete
VKLTLPNDAKRKRTQYWNTCIVLGCLGAVFMVPYNDEMNACGAGLCCFSMIFAISALTTPVNEQQVVVIQQQPQFVPVAQQPVQQRVARSQPPIEKPNIFAKTKEMWMQEAKNLELARNWNEAAKAYEKAGMYAEAGRIRKEYLEDKQPLVKIGKLGDTILNDSVMISEDNENNI